MKNYVIVVITSIYQTLVVDPWSLQQGPMTMPNRLCTDPRKGAKSHRS